MDRIRQLSEVRPALAAAAVFLCAGLSIASMFWLMYLGVALVASWPGWVALMALTSPLVFIGACILVFFRPTLGYGLGGIAAVVALPWFVLSESSGIPSVWTCLNGPDEFGEFARSLAILKILSVALIAAAATCSLLRLLPSGLLVQNSPLSRRTWPAIAVGVLVPALWSHHSAMPWMLPVIVDAIPPELRILHVEKRGLKFRETSFSYLRNGSFSVSGYDRRLFQYRFQSQSRAGSLPKAILERANDLAHSSALRGLRTAPPIALRSWNAEGWYVALRETPLLAFTSEYGTTPPREVREILEQIEKLPGAQRSLAIQDVCLGFCYDPVAGLGFWYSNQRCHTLANGTTQCL